MVNDKYEDRYRGQCDTCGQPFYREAFEAAKAIIEDSPSTIEMLKRYMKYKDALEKLESNMSRRDGV